MKSMLSPFFQPTHAKSNKSTDLSQTLPSDYSDLFSQLENMLNKIQMSMKSGKACLALWSHRACSRPCLKGVIRRWCRLGSRLVPSPPLLSAPLCRLLRRYCHPGSSALFVCGSHSTVWMFKGCVLYWKNQYSDLSSRKDVSLSRRGLSSQPKGNLVLKAPNKVI